MDIEITMDDPKAYTKTVRASRSVIVCFPIPICIESFCNDGEKDLAPHASLVTKDLTAWPSHPAARQE